jgi:lysophospholipid acyltransferase (LPLAT)-like uncharacterized protein
MVDSVRSVGKAEPDAERTPEAVPAPASPAKAAKKRRKRCLSTRILRSAGFQRGIAGLAANYLRFVNWTSPFAFDPPDAFARYIHLNPVIFTMWHGQHFMLPFARIFDFDARVLISRSSDGEINARVAEKLGVKTIRGSTARDPSRMMEKGALAGFVEMKAALAEGACVTMTADISNLAARRAGLGIVTLARASGRPIVPIAYASSRRIDVKSWDRSTINLPFSRAVIAVGEPVHVPEDADASLLEERRLRVETNLNEATARAYRIVDRRHG